MKFFELCCFSLSLYLSVLEIWDFLNQAYFLEYFFQTWQKLNLWRTRFFSTLNTIAESFYYVNYGLSIITSKKLSNNLSNQNKHLCFCCLQDKMWIKMPKWTIFVISFLWKCRMFCFDYWDYLTNFWCNNWQSIIDVVERLSYWRIT